MARSQHPNPKASMFVIHDSTRLKYAGLYLLKEIEDQTYDFKLPLEDDEAVLEPILHHLKEWDYIEVSKDDEYRMTSQGHSFLTAFWDRYNKFLSEYDIFCGVDLKTQDFAFNYYDRYASLDDWYEFLEEERWDDLRIAVAEYKGLDALEIVFMSFVNDQKYGRDDSGWDYDLLLGSVWDEIQTICNCSVRLGSLGYEKDGKTIAPEEAMEEVLSHGENLAKKIFHDEQGLIVADQ